MTFEQTKEQFLLAHNSNGYLNMCESDDMHNAIVALEKQIPKRVEKIKSGFKSFNYVCPECAYRQISQIEGEWIAGQHYNYCSNCGQALDWSDTE